MRQITDEQFEKLRGYIALKRINEYGYQSAAMEKCLEILDTLPATPPSPKTGEQPEAGMGVDWEGLYGALKTIKKHSKAAASVVERWLYDNDPRKTGDQPKQPPAKTPPSALTEAVKHIRTGMRLLAFPPNAHDALETLITAATQRSDCEYQCAKDEGEYEKKCVQLLEEIRQLKEQRSESAELGKVEDALEDALIHNQNGGLSVVTTRIVEALALLTAANEKREV